MPTLETVSYRGWARVLRLANREIEVLIPREIGPRLLRFGFVGAENVFGEFPEQMGRAGEREWQLRGGHRLWIAPESPARSYEPDNSPVSVVAVPGGVRLTQAPGPATGVQKSIAVTLADRRNEAVVTHRLTNRGRRPVTLAPWALSVMAPRGTALVPLPSRPPGADRMTPTHVWSLWSYTDLSDPRWTFGRRYLRFRQDPRRGPNKIGIAHQPGWAAYLRGDTLFVKRFAFRPGAPYPDGGVNFETYANARILELESLGPLVTLAPGRSVTHVETWSLYRGLPSCRSEADLDRHVGRRAERQAAPPA